MPSDPSQPLRHALGVDVGTSHTVAVARWPDGRTRPILIDGSPLLPSAVYAQRDGQLAVGRDAVHSARLDPARYEPHPKRRIDDGSVLLGDHEVVVADLFTAVLARVAEQWHRAVGPVRPTVTLTCPAGWGSARRSILAEAAAAAGFTGARLVCEPVAAASYFVEVLGRELPIGSALLVHDFGAGTFDVSVVARTAAGFEVLAADGRDDLGGLDVDAAVLEHLGRSISVSDPGAWRRLTAPTTVADRRAQRQLRDDVRVAKERLSRSSSADLVIPLADVEVQLTREELERLIEPLIASAVEVATAVLRRAELADGQLVGVFLVGGASRIPLVASMLHQALDEAPVLVEQPELVVAEGGILAEPALLTTVSVTPQSAAADADPAQVDPAQADPAQADPAQADPAQADPAQADPAQADPAEVDSVEVDRPQPVAAESAVPAPDVVKPDVVQPDVARTAQTELVPGGPAQAIDEAWAARRWDDAAALKLHEELWPDGQPAGDREPDSIHIPAVDPWPHAPAAPWLDDPQRTVAQDGWKPADPARQGDPAAAPNGPRTPTAASSSARATAKVRPQPPRQPQNRQQNLPSGQQKMQKVRPQQKPPPVVRTAPTRDRRRPRRLLRAVRTLLSMTMLVSAPVAVAVAAYGYGNGLPIQEDAMELGRDILQAINSWRRE